MDLRGHRHSAARFEVVPSTWNSAPCVTAPGHRVSMNWKSWEEVLVDLRLPGSGENVILIAKCDTFSGVCESIQEFRAIGCESICWNFRVIQRPAVGYGI